MRIENAGENAIIVYLGEGQSPEISDRVQQLGHLLSEQMATDLVDLVASYASLLVIFDALRTDHLAVRRKTLSALTGMQASESSSSALVTLPVYYDLESGPDLENLAHQAALTIEQVVDIHQSCEYRVYAIGFAPGFAYLGEVDSRIATPRLATPRQKVPKGAVAIADAQTAVYPAPSPGGWNLIGLCPTPMFNPQQEPPMPVGVGDRVRFESVSRQQFLDLGGEL